MTHRHDLVCADAVAVTPSDTGNHAFEGLYIGGAGDVTVVTEAGTTTTFSACPVGLILPVATRTVKSTLTTATNIVGFKP